MARDVFEYLVLGIGLVLTVWAAIAIIPVAGMMLSVVAIPIAKLLVRAHDASGMRALGWHLAHVAYVWSAAGLLTTWLLWPEIQSAPSTYPLVVFMTAILLYGMAFCKMEALEARGSSPR